MLIELQLKDIYKIYSSGEKEQRIETVAIKNLQLSAKNRDFITIMGPSGSGKTTLLNLLGGIDLPTTGQILVKTEDNIMNLTHLNNSELDQWRSGRVGMIFQNENLIGHLNALENVELSLKFQGINNRAKAIEILSELGLEKRIYHKIHQLSAGEKQRVALAATLVYDPLIILADEPTGELDSENVHEVMKLFKKISEKRDIIVILVTHNPDVSKYGNRYFTLIDGILEERVNFTDYDEFTELEGVYNLFVDNFGRAQFPLNILYDISKCGENTVLIEEKEESLKIELLRGKRRENGFFYSLVDKEGKILLPYEFWRKNSDTLLTCEMVDSDYILVSRRTKNE